MRKILGREKGFGLPLVLVVLVFGAFMVYVTFGIVENLFSTSTIVVDKVELYNAALDGVERAKAWIVEVRRTQGSLPRWEANNPYGELRSGEPYSNLLVRDPTGTLPDLNENGDIQVTVEIYDMDYQIGIDLDSDDYEAGFPPRMRYDYDELSSSLHQASTYAGTNRGEGSTGAGGGIQLGFYLIRSIATFEERQEIIEQAMIMRL